MSLPHEPAGASASAPSEDEGSVQDLREELDDEQRDQRSRTDTRRMQRQQMHDQSRQHARGGEQTRASLSRERRDTKSETVHERDQDDRSRAQERKATDGIVTRLTDARDEAEERVVELTVGDDLSHRDLRRVLKATRCELALIEEQLVAMLQGMTSGELEARLWNGAERIRASSGRIERALEGALDHEDTGSFYHDVGGSG